MEEIDACIVGFVLSCTTLIGPLVEKNRESISFCGLNLHGQKLQVHASNLYVVWERV
jgi:hypothetical protein